MDKFNFVKDYLRNKAEYDADIIEKIASLDESIRNQNDELPLGVHEVALNSGCLINPVKANRVSDISDALVRYNDLKKKYYEEHMDLMRSKIDYLNLLMDRKKIYDQASFFVFKLAPRQRQAVNIFMKGGKIAEIAAELACSYNTAKCTLDEGIQYIADEIVDVC